jgi:hypothetical protein
MFRIFANNVHLAISAHDFAFVTNYFYACSNFHINKKAKLYYKIMYFLFNPIGDSSFSRIVWRHFNFYLVSGHDSNKIQPHLPR